MQRHTGGVQSRHAIADRSGLQLAALFDTPDASRVLPFVLLLHGFTGWKEVIHLETLAQELVRRGIATIRFDAPGSGESDGTFADDYRLTNYLSSIFTVLDFAAHELPVDSERVGIWGHSMGGFAALATAARERDRWRAVCGCQPSMGRSIVPRQQLQSWQETGWATFSNERFPKIELPYAFYEDRQQYDALAIADQLSMPLLLIAGTNDFVVRSAGVRAIYEASPEPKTYREFPVGHDYKNDAEQLVVINDTTVEFFHSTLQS